MKDYNTFAPENILELENWIIVGAALLKMFAYFWPVIFVAIAILTFEYIKEERKK